MIVFCTFILSTSRELVVKLNTSYMPIFKDPVTGPVTFSFADAKQLISVIDPVTKLRSVICDLCEGVNYSLLERILVDSVAKMAVSPS